MREVLDFSPDSLACPWSWDDRPGTAVFPPRSYSHNQTASGAEPTGALRWNRETGIVGSKEPGHPGSQRQEQGGQVARSSPARTLEQSVEVLSCHR